MADKRYTAKELTAHLRELAAKVHEWIQPEEGEEGGYITKGEALARLLWQKALGFTETVLDEENKSRTIAHKPESWAIQLIYERLEGKSPQAITEDATRIRAVERVRELAAARINDITTKLVDPTDNA